MSKAEIRKPEAYLSSSGLSPDSVEVTFQIPVSTRLEGAPHASLTVHATSGSSSPETVSPVATDLISLMAEDQRKMYEDPEPTSLTIFDGLDEMVFSGFLFSPGYSISFGRLGHTKRVTHGLAKLDNLNTAIYRPPPGEPGAEAAAYKLDGAVIDGGDSPTEWMKVVLEYMIENKDFDSSGDENDEALRENIHTNNEEALKIWYEILDNSEVEIPGISEFGPDVAGAIQAIYMGTSSSFLGAIANFSAQFQMLLIPDMEGSSGKFISYADVVTGEAEDKKAEVSSLYIAAGSQSFLPVTQVVMKGIPLSFFRGETATTGPSGLPTVVAGYPVSNSAGGKIEIITSPSWMPLDAWTDDSGDSASESGDSLDLSAYKASVELQGAEGEKITIDSGKIATEYCRNHYLNSALMQSTANVSIPLDVTWEIGKRYKVAQFGNNDEGIPLFTGFLAGITHSLSSSPGSINASTSLMFTHVEANGFTLPNK